MFGVPDRPSGMTAAARRVWDSYVARLAALGILREVDGFSLARLCEDVAWLQDLRGGMKRMLTERERPVRENRARLRALKMELATLPDSADPAQREELTAEQVRLRAGIPTAPADVELASSHEGRRLITTMNQIAGRIARQELQFGLTPAAGARLEAMGVGMGSPAAAGAVAGSPADGIEQALCG